MVIVPKNNKTSVDSYHQSWKQDLYLVQKNHFLCRHGRSIWYASAKCCKKISGLKKNSYGIWINVASYYCR